MAINIQTLWIWNWVSKNPKIKFHQWKSYKKIPQNHMDSGSMDCQWDSLTTTKMVKKDSCQNITAKK